MGTERVVIGHFPSSAKAESAVNALAQIGLADAHVKRNSRYGVSRDSYRNDAISSQAETLTGLTLYSENTDNDENNATRVLLGADPSVSGYSTQEGGLAGGRAFTLVAFVPESRVEEAVAVLKEYEAIV